MQQRWRKAGAVAALVTLGGVGSLGAASLAPRDGSRAGPELAAVTSSVVRAGSDTLAVELSSAFRAAAREALPGVVHIRVESTAAVATSARSPFEGSPFEGTPFEDFFQRGFPHGLPNGPQAPQGPSIGSGSGFVFREDGYILTNNHVVDGATRVTVIFADKRELAAEVVGRDPNTDLAVIKVDADDLPVLRMGSSDAMQVGDWVVALGYPLELGSTVTAGIVSAKGRSIGIIGRDGEATAPLEHFIQTDAAINPGNSGGPLVDLAGRVVGVNSAIASPTGYYSGYGFAVPIALARRVAADLIEHGEVRRPKLGIGIRSPTLADAEAAGLDRPLGALVATVEPGSVGDEAGLRLNDVIVGVQGRAVESAGGLMELIARQQDGATVTLDVVRRGERIALEVELEDAFAPAVRADAPAVEASPEGVGRMGLGAAELTPALAERMGLGDARGVVVTEVAPSSSAARAGIRPGMILDSLNGRPVQSVSELMELVERLEEGEVATMVVRIPTDDGETRTVFNLRVGG